MQFNTVANKIPAATTSIITLILKANMLVYLITAISYEGKSLFMNIRANLKSFYESNLSL
jgi:hypothetical protein